MTRGFIIRVLLVAVLTASFAACGEENDVVRAQSTAAKNIKQLDAALVPGGLLDLQIKQEDMAAALKQANRSYVEAIGMWSMRREDLVQATLQVSRFNENADYKSSAFRRQVLQQIGGTAPQDLILGDRTVHLSRSTKQTLAVWFEDRYFFVLAVRDDYDKSRTLIREALKIEV